MKKKEKICYDGARPLGVLVYTAAVCIALMYTICREHYIICSVIMAALTAGLYLLLYVFRKRRLASALITLASVGLCALAISSVGTGWYEGGFIYFIFTASTMFDPAYAAAAIVLFSVVTGLVCCYFSAILPRMCFLMLPAFVPLVLSARTAGGLPLWIQIIVFGSLPLAVFCSARKTEGADTVVAEGKGTGQITIVAFIVAVVAVGVGAVLPKSSETLMSEYLNTVLAGGRGYNVNNQTLGNFITSSSVNKGNNQLPENLLFTVQTNIPTLLDRWVFDDYYGEEGWRVAEEYNMGYSSWKTYASKRKLSTLISDIKQGAEEGLLDEYAEVLASLPEYKTLNGSMYIRNVDKTPTGVIIHPYGTHNVQVKDFEGRIFRTPKSEIFTESDLISMEYYLDFYYDKPSAEYAAAISKIDFRDLLITANDRGVITDSQMNAFLDELNHAREYRSAVTTGWSIEVLQLVNEIIAGAENDYEKACAIERWFGEAGFVYDLEFVPEKTDAYYFIFDSRRGICSDFATAMTLFARVAGLPARYVEGFALSDDILDENGVYNVTGANAHAYTQIYIEGCGWLNFDATKHLVSTTEDSGDWVIPVVLVCGCGLLSIIIVYIFRKQIEWLIFKITYPFFSKKVRVRKVYIKARELAADIDGGDSECLLCGDVRRILSQSLSMENEAEYICSAADELLYSGKAEISADTKALIKSLKALRKQKRRLKL